jgi:hypothetical protein
MSMDAPTVFAVSSTLEKIADAAEKNERIMW